MTKNIKILIIVLLSCLILILLLIYSTTNKQPKDKTEPVKQFVPDTTPATKPATQIPAFSKDPILFEKQVAAQPVITDLISILPYRGKYFTLDYSLHDFLFTLTLDSSNRRAGMEEFDYFLKQHNIENLSLFTNLVIR
ncbi:hypothetical protein HYW43_04295 [Candidatus Daviesbacteria bacterium]|nr:hypothetical protein [Candidatus Daviesbacteria bacterium]